MRRFIDYTYTRTSVMHPQTRCDKYESIYGLQPQDVKLLQQCLASALGKSKRNTHNHKSNREPTGFGSHFHGDNTAPQHIKTKGGKSIVNVVVVCKHTHWTFTKALSSIKETVARQAKARYAYHNKGAAKGNQSLSIRPANVMNYCVDELLEEIGAVHETSATSIAITAKWNGRKCIQDIMP